MTKPRRSKPSANAKRAQSSPPSKRGSRARRKVKTKRRWSVWFLQAALFVAIATTAAVWTAFWYYGRDLPTTEAVRSYRPPQTIRVVDRHGQVLGERFRERRTVVGIDRVPRVMVLAVLAAEDADFYQHKGLDYPGLLRAVVRSLVSQKRPRGTSTITQQVVKLLLLSPEQTVARKIKELILARQLESEMNKNEILELYLNHINFGHGRYGVQEAAQFYFDRDVDKLTLADASMIAGIPQAPARLSPRTHPEAAERRRQFILNQLEQKRAEYWPDVSVKQIRNAQRHPPAIAAKSTPQDRAPEVVALALDTLREMIGPEEFGLGGYTVETTIDAKTQTLARSALRKGLNALDVRQGYRGPIKQRRKRHKRNRKRQLRPGSTLSATVVKTDDRGGLIEVDLGQRRGLLRLSEAKRYNPAKLTASRFAPKGRQLEVSVLNVPEDPKELVSLRLELGPEGAVVAIDPRTHEVLALVGSYSASPGFNRATQALRQPGSTFKPIVYGMGIQSRRFTPTSIVLDAPAVYDEWKPHNYETWRYEGAVRLREALARSINLVAVRVIDDLSPAEVVSFARQLGIESKLDPTLALALGASEVTLNELTNAYTTFAAGGQWAPARLVKAIVTPKGQRIRHRTKQRSRRVLTPAEAYIVTSMLESVVTSGTARAAAKLPFAVAGKTGTSNRARDAWFVGYSPNLVAGVWVGFDNRRPLGKREGGSRSALPIWIDFMTAAESKTAPKTFAVPSGVVTARVDPQTGLLARPETENALDEIFLDGTAPTEMAPALDVADDPSFMMEQFETPQQFEAPQSAAP